MPVPIASPEILFEEAGLPGWDLPEELLAGYGGPLGFTPPVVYMNFVSTLDGVVAMADVPNATQVISDASEPDRFVMGLLRALADVVLVGATTVNGFASSVWTAERIYPPAAGAFAELRRRLGLRPQPEIAVLTGSGTLEPTHPALEVGGVVLTSELGARTIGDRLPSQTTLEVLGPELGLDPRRVIQILHDRGHRSILCEGGPRVFGSLLGADLVDELFLTLSPLLAGRSVRGGRLGLVEGVELIPERTVEGRPLSIRKYGTHLFLRYALRQRA